MICRQVGENHEPPFISQSIQGGGRLPRITVKAHVATSQRFTYDKDAERSFLRVLQIIRRRVRAGTGQSLVGFPVYHGIGRQMQQQKRSADTVPGVRDVKQFANHHA